MMLRIPAFACALVLAAVPVPRATAQDAPARGAHLEAGTLAGPIHASESPDGSPSGLSLLSPHALAAMGAAAGGHTWAGPRSRFRTVGFAVGGAVVGAWGGYLLSQAVKSDWEKTSNGEFRSHRVQFAVGGAALGTVGGILVGSRGSSASPLAHAPETTRRTLISKEEIEQFGAGSVYELIQARRPIWLRKRSTTPSGEMLPLQVYVDHARMDDVHSLRQLSTAQVLAIEYFDGTAATLRFGWDHPQGAIMVSTFEAAAGPVLR